MNSKIKLSTIMRKSKSVVYPIFTFRWLAVHALAVPTVFFLGSIAGLLLTVNILPRNFFTVYAQQIGSVLEFILPLRLHIHDQRSPKKR